MGGNNAVNRIDVLGQYPGSRGHGEIIGPEESSTLVSNIQSDVDIAINGLVAAAPESYNISIGRLQYHNPHFKSDVSYLRNILRLLRFNRQIGTNDGNRFVFTCKWGWIDHGHYMNNALLTYAAAGHWGAKFPSLTVAERANLGRFSAWAGSLANEIGQMAVLSNSSFTREDLISNMLGREMGVRMVNHDFLAIGIAQRGLGRLSPPNSALGSANFYDIQRHWKDLLVSSGAVKWGSGVKAGGKTPEEWFREEFYAVRTAGAGPLGFSVGHALQGYRETTMWKCLCDGDRPKLEAHIYK